MRQSANEGKSERFFKGPPLRSTQDNKRQIVIDTNGRMRESDGHGTPHVRVDVMSSCNDGHLLGFAGVASTTMALTAVRPICLVRLLKGSLKVLSSAVKQ